MLRQHCRGSPPGSSGRCGLLELDDDVLAVVLQVFTVRYTPRRLADDVTVGPAVDRVSDDAASSCASLALTCRKLSVLVCLATGRRQLEEVPRTLSCAVSGFGRCLSALRSIRETESALAVCPLLRAPDDTAHRAFEETLHGQQRDAEALAVQCDVATAVLRLLDAVRLSRDDAHAHDKALAAVGAVVSEHVTVTEHVVLLAAHRMTKSTVDGLARQTAMLHAAAAGQVVLLEGALRLQRDAYERATMLGLPRHGDVHLAW